MQVVNSIERFGFDFMTWTWKFVLFQVLEEYGKVKIAHGRNKYNTQLQNKGCPNHNFTKSRWFKDNLESRWLLETCVAADVAALPLVQP